MPHINLKHFPAPLTEQQQDALVADLTAAVRRTFGCDEGVISIALEPVAEADWNEQVYVPEIVGRKDLLRKTPNY
ncbi:tautomerase PptA [Streptomyces sp. NPDC020379]|uniref:tautomerase PptA n=1 Tax=Streptomyces sp. NPDC020379 TaxID=3365071 RepID=UPI0037A4DC49